MAQQILFYIFSTIAILSAVMVITSKHPVRAVLSLVLTFFAMACVWLILQVEFLALVLIVVYVGAVMVLFLFVVMMLDIQPETLKAGFVRYWPLAAVIGVLLAVMLIWNVGFEHFGLKEVPAPAAEPVDYSSIQNLGMALFTDYLYPFELAAALLLAAMIAAITLTFRGHHRGGKIQNIKEQLAADPKARLKIVKMPVEKPAVEAPKPDQTKPTDSKDTNK
jgi:NADH-quinone oxidoreductase subunit J